VNLLGDEIHGAHILLEVRRGTYVMHWPGSRVYFPTSVRTACADPPGLGFTPRADALERPRKWRAQAQQKGSADRLNDARLTRRNTDANDPAIGMDKRQRPVANH
jgi:hypothetical protein